MNAVLPPRSTIAARLEVIIAGLLMMIVVLKQPSLNADDVRQLVVDVTELLSALAITRQLPLSSPAV